MSNSRSQPDLRDEVNYGNMSSISNIVSETASMSDKQSSSGDPIAAEDNSIEGSPSSKRRIPDSPTTTQRKAEKQLERLLYDPVNRPDFEGCRHDFGEDGLRLQIPNKDDYVFFAAVPILEEYNAQSMHRHYDPLLIEALNIAPTLFYGMDSTSAVHCLVRHELFVKVQLKLVCHLDYGWSAATVMLKDEDRWIPLQQWLKTLPEPTLPNYHVLAYEEQYQWWKSTGKPFRLLDLPGELQERIFLFAVGEYVEPHFREECDLDENGYGIMQDGTRDEDWVLKKSRWTVITHGTHRAKRRGVSKYDWTARPAISPVNLGILCLSKETREAALYALWKQTTKVFRSPQSIPHRRLRSFDPLMPDTDISGIPTYVPPRFRPYLSRIQLALDNVELLLLFGVPLPGINDAFSVRPSPPPAHVFPTLLPHLKYLDIYFQSTAKRSYNPWHTNEMTSDRDRRAFLTEDLGMDLQRMPCQRILHDWILTYAYEYIHGIPKIELSGFIKVPLKTKWERLLNPSPSSSSSSLSSPSSSEENSEAKTSTFIAAEKAAKNLYRPSEYPPQCICQPFPCGTTTSAVHAVQSQNRQRCRRARHNCNCFPHWSEFRDAFAEYAFDFEEEEGRTGIVSGAGRVLGIEEGGGNVFKVRQGRFSVWERRRG
ncbi:hypothetical protein D0862_13633 [Hortaea werneckii]|uniref:Uncharacterized protein n=1 Tax=Hortaea werneckii TaxID=91943 RepID=A0A3M7EKP8_HORWE|nr:hypothetical protein D0862_13633 [Hortaea werneckii]